MTKTVDKYRAYNHIEESQLGYMKRDFLYANLKRIKIVKNAQ